MKITTLVILLIAYPVIERLINIMILAIMARIRKEVKN